METRNYWDYAILVLGLVIMVISAFLMVEGHILGERTTGIATVLGIVGIGTLSKGRRNITRRQKAKKS